MSSPPPRNYCYSRSSMHSVEVRVFQNTQIIFTLPEANIICTNLILSYVPFIGCPTYLGRDLWVSGLWGWAVILPPSRLLSGRFYNKIVLIHFAQSTTLHTWKVLRSDNFDVKIICAFIFYIKRTKACIAVGVSIYNDVGTYYENIFNLGIALSTFLNIY